MSSIGYTRHKKVKQLTHNLALTKCGMKVPGYKTHVNWYEVNCLKCLKGK